jgi:4'-phosphopantetheinyl transferase
MPLIFLKHIEQGRIGLWEISEELEELIQYAHLSESDKASYCEISALHRKKEWLAVRALLNKLYPQAPRINYHGDGRPHLETGEFQISISHTKGFVAVLLHKTASPGIDIELSSRDVERVASRFLSDQEMEACRNGSQYANRMGLIHWCAKEAIFKMIPLSNIQFATDISIHLNDTTLDHGTFKGIFSTKSETHTIQLEYLEFKKVLIVWGCNEGRK